jgi:hypothetical protein
LQPTNHIKTYVFLLMLVPVAAVVLCVLVVAALGLVMRLRARPLILPGPPMVLSLRLH